MVAPEHRRGLQREGMFLAIARAYYDWFGERPPVYCNYGFPNRAAGRIGQRYLRYLPVHDGIPTVYHNLFDEPPGFCLDSPGAGHLRVERVTAFAPDVDDLWQRVAPTRAFTVLRDHRYVTARYSRFPGAIELWETRDAGRLRAIAVARHRWVGQPILALLDYLAADDDVAALAATLQHAVEQARSKNLARVELWLPPWSRESAEALRLGLRTERSGANIVMRLPGHWDEFPWHRDRFFFTIGDSDIL
jgi:hypothetical protein